MKRVVAILSIALCTGFVALPLCNAADRAPTGQELFQQKCASCHPSPTFHPSEKVSNLQALRSQVEVCADAAKAGWGPEELGKVATYLNEIYYKFPSP